MKRTDTSSSAGGGKAKKPRAKAQKTSLFKKTKFVLLNLLGMVAFVALVAYIALWRIDSYTNHGETHSVPNVCGLQIEDAAKLLDGKSMTFTVVDRKYKALAAKDEVLEQYPEAGAQVKEGRNISLVLNVTSRPKATIPSVIDNRTFREAESHIKAAGFSIEKIDTIYGEKDWVYELRYEGRTLKNGETIPQGSSITVVIGNGKGQLRDDVPVFDSAFDI